MFTGGAATGLGDAGTDGSVVDVLDGVVVLLMELPSPLVGPLVGVKSDEIGAIVSLGVGVGVGVGITVVSCA